MDDRQLEKKFKDKKFLKTNDFINATGKLVQFLNENRHLVIAAIAVIIVGVVSIYGYKLYRLNEIEAFNKKLFEAQKSLKKDTMYRELMAQYKDIPASQLVRLMLIDDLLDHNQTKEAQTEIEQGLNEQKQNIFTTLLVLKGVTILKDSSQYLQAADYALKKEDKIIPTYRGTYKLMIAELYLLADNKDKAKQVYEKIIASTALKKSGQIKAAEYDPTITTQAKDKLLLLELGVI